MNKHNNLNQNSITSKIIKDPLYNYIEIEPDICEKIIDSKYFQRLRRIEQTSMRCLYPSARHDRFVHSLGTYHLAKMAIKSITQNNIIIGDHDEKFLEKLNENQCKDISQNERVKRKYLPEEQIRDSLIFSFEMAALLHDIGHSPFSHTLENFFKVYYKESVGDIKDEKIINIFFREIADNVEKSEEDFEIFKKECGSANASAHEIVSCIIIIKCFKEALDILSEKEDTNRGGSVDYCFMARCILGATYTDKSNHNDYKNCLIKLLNSSIDVDKLDYIARDSKISGYDNTSVDTSRLINSFALALNKVSNNNYELCLIFKKTGISIIENVILSRNALYRWIYSHHKVKYESDLFVKSVKEISLLKRKDDKDKISDKLFISKYFSVKSIEEKLVCDDTIWNLFMKYKEDVNEVAELVDRSTQKLAIWKSYAEFQAYFNNGNTTRAVGEFDIKQMEDYFKGCKEDDKKVETLEKYLNDYGPIKDEMEKRGNEPASNYKLTVVICNTSYAEIKPDEVLVYINNKLHAFDRILGSTQISSDNSIFFYTYCSKKIKNILNSNNYKQKDDFIEYIKKFDDFKFKPHN